MYQALYRKWRPMTFGDVVGQPQVTETLRRQVESGRLSHAYLFTGTRGTGKTTCAKLLAKAVNCENPHGGEPCNECASCRGVNDGSLSDVIEIDAASNNGVENIRSLREQTVFSPAEARKRVYIIDECHMLSAGAFNALLKTLEEPPEHVLFILATTELHKVPATILSRCQRFAFRRLAPQDISLRLRKIAEAERLSLTEDGALLIARLAEGGMRDAISMLDQVAASDARSIDEDAVFTALGLAGYGDSLAAIAAAENCDVRAALERLDAIYRSGKDLPAFLGELGRLLRDLLIVEATGDLSLTGGGYRADELRSVSLGRARLMAALEVVSDAQMRMQRSLDRRLDAELCLIRLCDPALGTASSSASDPAILARLDALESAVKNGARVPKTSDAEPKPAHESAAPPKAATPADNAAPKDADAPHASDVSDAQDADGMEPGAWAATLTALASKLGTPDLLQLRKLPPPKFEGNTLLLDVREDFARAQLARGEALEAVAAAASEALGRKVGARLAKAEDDERMMKLAEKFSKFDNFELT